MHERPLGAQISRMLANRGIEVIFGIPGVHNIELYRGLADSGLTHVLARHEQGAGFMADGYARATGRPGVAYVISGPGLTNIMTPMGQAYSDSVPLLVISSCLDETAAKRSQLHQMRDQEGAARTVCDWSQTARDAESVYGLIDRALSEFRTARQRPKHISVPIGVLGAPAPAAPPEAPQAREMGSARPQDVAFIADRLKEAKRPLFIFGGGARRALCWDVLQRSGAASFTTYAGRGVVPAGAPLHFGSYLGRPSSADILGRADFLVAVGTELSEVDLWRDALGHTCHMARIDIDPGQLADRHRAVFPAPGDAYWTLRALEDALDGHAPATEWTAQEVAERRARWRAEVDAERPGILPIADALRAALPPDTLIYSDMTQFAYVAKEVWDMAAPGLWHHPTGFGTLGYALPAAIGGKVGAGDRPVVAIAGDYGFQYTLQELGTAAELGLSLPILLWDNAMLKEIEASMASAQIAPVAIKALNPDFGTLAAAYGIGYARPESLPDLQRAVKDALGRPGPTLIHMTPATGG